MGLGRLAPASEGSAGRWAHDAVNVHVSAALEQQLGAADVPEGGARVQRRETFFVERVNGRRRLPALWSAGEKVQEAGLVAAARSGVHLGLRRPMRGAQIAGTS